MAIRTKMQKSGMKNVVNKKRSNVSGRLNRAARAVSTGERSNLTPGAVTEIFGGAETRIRNKKRAAITGNRRRRHAAHAGKGTLSRNAR